MFKVTYTWSDWSRLGIYKGEVYKVAFTDVGEGYCTVMGFDENSAGDDCIVVEVKLTNGNSPNTPLMMSYYDVKGWMLTGAMKSAGCLLQGRLF